MFSKLSLHERYYIFVSICLIWMLGHQSYYNYRVDALIHESLEEGNKLVKARRAIDDKLRQENEGLEHDLMYEQVSHRASKIHIKMLKDEINILGNYYREEISKVNDELFDLKNKKKDE